MIGHLLQLNENKVTLHLLGQIMTEGVNQGILQEAKSGGEPILCNTATAGYGEGSVWKKHGRFFGRSKKENFDINDIFSIIMQFV